MNFELLHIKCFIAVAERLHFRKAAEKLFMTQSGLSRRIKWLEDQLGARLLVRSTHSVCLTEAGKSFFAEAKKIIASAERAATLARRIDRGKPRRLSIAYMDFAINGALPHIIQAFRKINPDIMLDLQHMPSSIQKKELLESKIDVGVLIGPYSREHFIVREISNEPLLLLMPEKHRLLSQKIRLADLENEQFVIGTEGSWSIFRSAFYEICHGAGFVPKIVQEASTSDGIFGLVAAGSGVSLYPKCYKNIRRKGIVTRPIRDLKRRISTVAVWRSDNNAVSQSGFGEFLLNLGPLE